jgi:hypothetical protein
VSLILEALKKLDREKQAPDRGLVVVGPSAWPSLGDGRPGIGAGAVAVGVLAVAGVGAAVWVFQGGRHPAVSSSAPVVAAGPAAAVPAPQVVARASPAKGRSTAPSPAPGSAAAPKAARGSLAEPVETSARETVAAESLPAPTATGARGKETRPGSGAAYQLQAISAQNGQPVAILNDRLVREGDSFDGVKVLRIGADEVEIEVAGHRRVVKF